MRVYFIVHGNVKTGMGHIMRSISLADAFRMRGHTVVFFSKYEQGILLLQKAGLEVCQIPSGTHPEEQGFFYGNPEELDKDIAAIRRQAVERADVIIVDSYNVSREFFLGLKEMTGCLVYIDDLDLFHYPIDILVNGTASAFDMGYGKSQSAQLLLGTKFNQVRKEFSGLPLKVVKETIADILVTTGNGDPFHVTEKILEIFRKRWKIQGFRYHVIVGGGFEKDIWSNKDIICDKQVFLYDNPSNIWEIMLKCDLAVTAGGSTLYELAACGVVTATFAYADNQIPHIKALERHGVLKYIGAYDKLNEQELIDYIKYLMKHVDMRRWIVKESQTLVDGKGCERIVEKIEQTVR